MKLIITVKKWLAARREAKIQRVWDKKDDSSIIVAYCDARDWLALENKGNFKLPKSLKASCQMRLDKHILPQMKKRCQLTPTMR